MYQLEQSCRSAQATAVWNPVERAAQVAAHAGKHLHKMGVAHVSMRPACQPVQIHLPDALDTGYRRGGHQYLHIEEAL